MFITIFALLTVLASLTKSTYLFKEDRACDPARSNVIIPYTGYRIQRQYTYGLPILHHVRLSHCEYGKVENEAFLPTDRNTDIAWGENMCLDSSGWCYRLVRRRKYAARTLSVFIPRTIVGGIFLCPANSYCTNENARPILPLLADYVGNQWYEFARFRRVIKRVPYLYTPSMIDYHYPHRADKKYEWAEFLDVNENYTSNDKESHMIQNTITSAINLYHRLVSIDPKLLPWEYGRLDLEAKLYYLIASNYPDSYALLLQLEQLFSPLDGLEDVKNSS